jgi:hypothetical protein
VSSCIGDFLYFKGDGQKGRGAIIIRYRYALDRETVISVKLKSPIIGEK